MESRTARRITMSLPLLAGMLIAGRAHAAPGTPKVTIGYCTDDLEKAKAGGFEYAELGVKNFTKLSDDDFAKLLEKHKAAGLPTPVGNVFLPGEIKVVGPEIDKEKQMAHVQKAFERAEKLGLKIVVFGSGGSRKVPDGFSKDEAWKQLVEFAKRIAPEAKKHGITVAVEPLRKEETNIINTAAEGMKWVQAVNHPNFQLMVDFYHLASEKEDPVILEKAKKYIKHIHIANPNGRVFPQSSDEYDYSGFFKYLKKIRYQGGISVEAKSNAFDAEAPKAIAFLRAAYESGVKPPTTAKQ